MNNNILINSTFLGVGEQVEPNTIQLKETGKELLTIHADGRITVSEDCKPTETAAEVLRIMRDQWLADIQCAKIRELQDRIKRLEHGIAKQNLEIEQTCGRVLDYPWFKDDQKNFPGATEKDGVCVGEHVAETIAAELARKYTEAKQRIKRLEEAWIPASTKPEGYERRVLLWVVWQGFGWRDQPEAIIGWWRHGPGCFAFDEFENADHLVTHWMEIADPTKAKEAKP
jgi:hypothetical protein